MICPKCGTPNRASAKFCDECGYELPSVAPIARQMFDEEEPQTCTPKSAPTADLSGVDQPAFPVAEKPKEETAEDAEEPASEPESEVEDEVNEEVTEVTEEQAEEPKTTSNEEGISETDEASDEDELESESTAELVPVGDDEEATDELDTNPTQVLEPVGDTKVISESDSLAAAENEAEEGEPGIEKTAVMPKIQVDDESSKNYSAANTDGTKQKSPALKRGIIIALCTIAAIAAIAGGTYAAQLWGGKVVPDVMGATQEEAIAEVQAAGFVATTEEIASDDVSGIVIGMTPSGNSRAGEGSTVALQISTHRVIPDIIGKSLTEVKELMTRNGFTNVEYETQKSDSVRDSVITVSPEVGTSCKANAKITITTAVPYTVPNVEGMTQDAAIAAVREAGFTPLVQTQSNEAVPEGNVISSYPAAESELQSGSTVTIYVAKHRSSELEELTRQFFAASNHLTIDGGTYILDGVNSIAWTSGNHVAFTITVTPYQSIWFITTPITGDQQTIQGSIDFDDNNNIVLITPTITQG